MLAKLLDFVGGITTWRRAGIVLVLGAAALGGTIVYQAQDRLLAAVDELVRTPPRAHVDAHAIETIAPALLATLPDHPRGVLVWHVDLETNRRWLLGYAGDDEIRTALDQDIGPRLRASYPIFRAVPGANHLIIGALNGDVACGPPVGTDTERALYARFHVATLCVVGIPPEVGQLAGLLVAGFTDPLSPELVEQVRPLLWTAAAALAGHEQK